MMMLLLHTFLAPLILGTGNPKFGLSNAGDLAIGFPAELFKEKKIETQLQSGLTTTMLVTVVGQNGRKVRGGARVDIRFEPWDEIYHISIFHYNGDKEILVLQSHKVLMDLLTGRRIRIASSQAAARLLVTLQVLPFSKTEQVDTQKWFSKTLASNQQGSGYMLDLIFAASIKRKTSRKFQWTVDWEP